MTDTPTAPLVEIPSLDALADRYDGVICDLWGVLHNGVAVFEAAQAALARAAAAGKGVVFLSNAPRPAEVVVRQLSGFGVPETLYRAVVTSGDAARRALAGGRLGRRWWHLGPERDRPLAEGIGLELVPLAQAEGILCTGLFDDTTETAADYAGDLGAARARDLVMVCANPDLVVVRGTREIPCAGALAQAYAALGGQVRLFGKPGVEVFDMALAALGVPRERALVIGDGLRTDIKGARAAGIDALLIAGGIHADALGVSARDLDLDRIARVAAAEDGAPRYVMRALA